MAKKTSSLTKRRPPITMPGDPPTKIRETLVGDPSISFTIGLDPEMPMSPDGYYVKDFNVEIYLSDIPAPSTNYTKIARIHIKSLSMLDPYFYVPFGDPDYGAGQEFNMKLKLSGKDPVTGEPIIFGGDDNWFSQSLIGGGIVENFKAQPANGKSNGKPKKRKR